jgi:hypothetical protein
MSSIGRLAGSTARAASSDQTRPTSFIGVIGGSRIGRPSRRRRRSRPRPRCRRCRSPRSPSSHRGSRTGLPRRPRSHRHRRRRVCRDVVGGEILVDVAAEPWVENALLEQRRRDPHRHPADELRPRRLRLITRPHANTPSARGTRTSPVAGSTATSTNCAPRRATRRLLRLGLVAGVDRHLGLAALQPPAAITAAPGRTFPSTSRSRPSPSHSANPRSPPGRPGSVAPPAESRRSTTSCRPSRRS